MLSFRLPIDQLNNPLWTNNCEAVHTRLEMQFCVNGPLCFYTSILQPYFNKFITLSSVSQGKEESSTKNLCILVPAPLWHLFSTNFLQLCRKCTFFMLFWTNFNYIWCKFCIIISQLECLDFLLISFFMS